MVRGWGFSDGFGGFYGGRNGGDCAEVGEERDVLVLFYFAIVCRGKIGNYTFNLVILKYWKK